MTDPVTGIVSSICACFMGMALFKICAMRDEDPNQENQVSLRKYLLIRADHIDGEPKYIIQEQYPQVQKNQQREQAHSEQAQQYQPAQQQAHADQLAPLPEYTEKDSLI
jgi:hypothetical protein